MTKPSSKRFPNQHPHDITCAGLPEWAVGDDLIIGLGQKPDFALMSFPLPLGARIGSTWRMYGLLSYQYYFSRSFLESFKE